MSASVELHESREAWQTPRAKPLDEKVWELWMVKGRIENQRSGAARVKAVKWVSTVVLLATAGLWSILPPYQAVSGFIVTAGAMFLMIQALQAGHYSVAGIFGVLVMLYNPVAPLLSYSGDWQRPLGAMSAVPFIASLAWRTQREASNG